MDSLQECMRLVPLSGWMERAAKVSVPAVATLFSPAFPVSQITDALDSKKTPALTKAFNWAKQMLEEYERQGVRVMVRFDCASSSDIKHMAHRGVFFDNEVWRRVVIDDPRIIDCTVGESTCIAIRHWEYALMMDTHPMEFRVFYGPNGYQGISSYYPQRPLHSRNTTVQWAMQECIDLASRLYHSDTFPAGFTADFLVAADKSADARSQYEKPKVIFLEGGPPHIPGAVLSAHPCCFPEGVISGVALSTR